MKKSILLGAALFLLVFQPVFSQTFPRKVLFEEATNASCAPCAQNNPILKAYLESKGDSIIAIKYHSSWPGFDPMYNHNTTENTARIVTYYGINAVPWLNVDGIIQDVWPFTNANFNNAFYNRIAIPSPVLVSVSDTRITGDSIRAQILVYKPTGLPAGNYKLRVFAVEKKIIYAAPPGNNGESVFEHVFRKAYPNTDGTVVTTTAGTQNFTFTYKIHPEWKDTSMYTVAFVQNDNNKEVLNVGKGSYNPTGISNTNQELPEKFSLEQNYPNPFNPVTIINFSLPKEELVTLRVYDMLGREIAVLVNGKINAGNYSVDWNATGFSSGIYFYTLTAGEFISTKKMMLIK